jgi:hypothetical protein
MPPFLLLAMLSCLQEPCISAAPSEPRTRVTPGWSVDYRWIDETPRPDETRRVWIGLRNGSDTPVSVCMEAVSYTITHPDGSMSFGPAAPMVAHTCRELSQFTLVLPSQTSYVLGEVRLPYEMHYSFRFSIHAKAYDYRGQTAATIFAELPETGWNQ